MIKRLLSMGGVITVSADVCQFGLEMVEDGTEHPAKKPAIFATSSAALARILVRRCRDCPFHIELRGSTRTKASAKYIDEL